MRCLRRSPPEALGQGELELDTTEREPALKLLPLLIDRDCLRTGGKAVGREFRRAICCRLAPSSMTGVSSGHVWSASGSLTFADPFPGCNIMTPAKFPHTPSTKRSMLSQSKWLNSSKKTPPVTMVKHDQFTWQSGITNDPLNIASALFMRRIQYPVPPNQKNRFSQSSGLTNMFLPSVVSRNKTARFLAATTEKLPGKAALATNMHGSSTSWPHLGWPLWWAST
mmetsp:Transcript_105385/g.314773  ORF Transcript_105385/g.314773 Transcript_105385/m.314773 type:complete len:225 (+) Transcript_105385:1099-1773(+)